MHVSEMVMERTKRGAVGAAQRQAGVVRHAMAAIVRRREEEGWTTLQIGRAHV